MRHGFKVAILHALKRVGAFPLCRWLTRRGVRILCYHGISQKDEHTFDDMLFMQPATFRRRMARLAAWGYPVVPLAEAVRGLDGGELPPCATVITVDDGWSGTCSDVLPILREHNMPATVYVTTHYALKEVPVFNVAVRYAYALTTVSTFALPHRDATLAGPFDLSRAAERARACDAVLAFGEARLNAEERWDLAVAVAEALDVSLCGTNGQPLFLLLTAPQMQTLVDGGLDLQLHTHRHALPQDDRMECEREIQENRDALRPFVREPLAHLCYPSGAYHPRQWPWLAELGIVSATTTKPGLNYRDTPRLELRRFVDGENVTDIEFEAELCGLLELLRRVRGWVIRPAARAGA